MANNELGLPPSGTVATFAHLSDLDQFTVRPGEKFRDVHADARSPSTVPLYSCPKPFYKYYCGVTASGKT